MFRKNAEIARLEKVAAALQTEVSELKHTVIRVSYTTDLGIRPVYQAELQDAIMMTRFQGGNGIIDKNTLGVNVEVISQWSTHDTDY